MSDPIDSQTNPTEIFIGHGMRAETGYGDCANLQPSSLLPGDKIKYSAEAKKLRPVEPVDVKASMVRTNRNVSAKPLATRVARGDRNQEPARVPAVTNRRPVVEPGAASRFKR